VLLSIDNVSTNAMTLDNLAAVADNDEIQVTVARPGIAAALTFDLKTPSTK
jgi:hypothetical protein